MSRVGCCRRVLIRSSGATILWLFTRMALVLFGVAARLSEFLDSVLDESPGRAEAQAGPAGLGREAGGAKPPAVHAQEGFPDWRLEWFTAPEHGVLGLLTLQPGTVLRRGDSGRLGEVVSVDLESRKFLVCWGGVYADHQGESGGGV